MRQPACEQLIRQLGNRTAAPKTGNEFVSLVNDTLTRDMRALRTTFAEVSESHCF